MFRALFSVAIVLLLSTIALLLYANYIHVDRVDKPAVGADLAAKPPPVITPVAPPAPPTPTGPVVVTEQPHAEPVASHDRKLRPVDWAEERNAEHRDNRAAHGRVEAGPGQRTYVVEAGDSLWNISMKNYGSGEYAGKIAELNHLSNSGRIRPGQVLVIPDVPKRANLSKTDEADQSSAAPEKPEPPAEAEPVETTEKKPDNNAEFEIQPPMLNVQVQK